MKRAYRMITVLLLLLTLTGCGVQPEAQTDSGKLQSTEERESVSSDIAQGSGIEVHFLDVGQGDCTLICCDEHYMLIDAGDESKGTLVQNYLQKRGVKKLDYLILTHPDSDHIGGAPVVITKFEIDTVFMSNYTKDNKMYDKLLQSLVYRNLTYSTPSVGSVYSLGDAQMTILAPNREYTDPNNASIALLLEYGVNTFLFTGDAEELAEKDILENGYRVQADVYKAGHHGSKTSTSEAFFTAVQPAYAVISCAEGNSYGHPHAQTLNTFRMNGTKVYRTDEAGTIIATSDGSSITFDIPVSDSWIAGEPTGQTASAAGGGSLTGTSSAINSTTAVSQAADTMEESYVLNSKTKKFHLPGCGSVPTSNRVDSTKSREELIAAGYSACQKCKP